MKNYSLTTLVLFIVLLKNNNAQNGVWRWECKEGFCQKQAITPETRETAISIAACRLLCSDASSIWPKPTGKTEVGNTLVKVNINSIDLFGINYEARSYEIAAGSFKLFKQQLENLAPNTRKYADAGKSLEIHYVLAHPNITNLALNTEEGYTLTVAETSDGRLNATIVADNIYGARNGLSTLQQLIVFDDLRDEYIMPDEVNIEDKPAYTFRGLGLDTSRNYISVDAIKRTLIAMGASKLNSFHWHITDSHSFPFTAESLPELQQYGAYTPKKIYTTKDVEEIVQLGKETGVRVIPEFDAPAHVGEGWQNTDFLVCFNAKPWQNFCVEPPCGQLNPTKDELYDTLELLYGDMIKQFNPTVFHMGGDEVHFGCWNSSDEIVNWMKNEKGWGNSEADFVKLWDHFQSESLARLYKHANKIPVILWTSTLTQKEYLEHLPKDQYIIQIWTTGSDPQVSNLLNNGYSVIISNYDALYLDCGFAGWVSDGNNWCSPYKGWQTIYENKPAKIAGDKKSLVLGAEAPLWTEQVDSASVDSRLWPRAAALAEVLWSEPTTSWRAAESRFLVHRERLIDLGINADALEPEWCRHYEESCPLDGIHNGNFTDVTTANPDTSGSVTTTLSTSFIIFNLILLFLQ